MSLKNRFSLILAVSTFMASCGGGAERTMMVRPETYRSGACWTDAQGGFAAFMVLAADGRIAVPYLISANCLVDGPYTSNGEAILHHLNAIYLTDTDGRLQASLPRISIVSNLDSDQPAPSSSSRIFYFRARLRRVPNDNKIIYVPETVMELSELNMTFEHFLGLSREQREQLLRERDQ